MPASHTLPTEQAPLDYDAAARATALWLVEFCDETLRYPDMIAEAARRAAKAIEETRRDLAAAREEQDTRASWLADWVITNHGGTPDIPAWVEQSARFYRDMARERDQAVSRALQAAADVCESRARSLSEDSHQIMLANEAHKCARAILGGALDRITGIPFSLTTSTVDLLTIRNLELQARVAELEGQLPHREGCEWERGQACNCRTKA